MHLCRYTRGMHNGSTNDASAAGNGVEAAGDVDVEPDEFWQQMELFQDLRCSYNIVAAQMNRATQQAIIRHLARFNCTIPGATQDTIPDLYGVPVRTADVPFGKCQYVIDWTDSKPALITQTAPPGE